MPLMILRLCFNLSQNTLFSTSFQSPLFVGKVDLDIIHDGKSKVKETFSETSTGNFGGVYFSNEGKHSHYKYPIKLICCTTLNTCLLKI